MPKVNVLNDFTERYGLIASSDSKTDRFAKIVLRLLSETFLVQDKKFDSDDYYVATSVYKELLEDFFRFLDISFIVDKEKRLCYIKGDNDRNRLRLRKLDTVLLLVLRSLSFSSDQDFTSLVSTQVSVRDILNKITETEIYPNGINMTAFTDSLNLLRRYKVVDFNDDPGKDETMISIYNSILLLVSSSSLEELAGRLSKYVGVTEDEETTTDKAD